MYCWIRLLHVVLIHRLWRGIVFSFFSMDLEIARIHGGSYCALIVGRQVFRASSCPRAARYVEGLVLGGQGELSEG